MERLQIVKAELQRSHCPAVMVLAHPQVEAACNLNGLTLAELLRPFGVIRQLNGTVGGALCFQQLEIPSRCPLTVRLLPPVTASPPVLL